MKRLFTYTLAALIGLVDLPGAAGAQVYPERMAIAVKARTLVEGNAYQRRSRDDNREEQTERTTKVIRLGADGVLALGNISGDITVSRAGGADTTIDVVKTARGRTPEDAKEMLKLVTVEIGERNGRADVRARYPAGPAGNDQGRKRHLNVNVAYTVTAPAGTRISVETISGSVKVSDIKGDINANSISGDVRINGAGRIGTAKTISGTVEISDTQTDGAVAGSSVSGDVVFRRVTARRLDGGTVSGNIKLEDVQCERISAWTTSGNVWFAGTLARTGHYELKSFSGEVRVLLAGNTGFEVNASSFSGDVRTDFPITTRGSNPPNRRGRQTTLAGTYGDGAAVLDLTTFSGSIVIAKK
jgi:putative adhesin